MSITINLSNHIEEKIKSITTQSGVALEDFLEQIITQNIEERLSKEEALLLKINQSVEVEKWQRFYDLKEKRNAETLTEKEHEELISIYNEIEEVHAQRMLYLVELSELRNVNIRVLMKELGIK